MEEKKLISKKEDIGRVKTYIEGFDEALDGGVPEGFVVLMAGRPGTMKSSLSFNVLFNEVLHNKKNALYLTLEQSALSLLNHMISLNFPVSDLNVAVISDMAKLDEKTEQLKSEDDGTLIIVDMGALRKELEDMKNINPESDWLNVLKNVVDKLKQVIGVDLFVVDSLSALYATSEFKNPRQRLFHMFEFLRDLDLTTFLISEMPPELEQYGEYGVEDYLADGIIRLALKRDGRKFKRELSVVKMRATDSNMDVFILDYANDKFRALSKVVE